MQQNDIPVYVVHGGTIKISGATDCSKAAKCGLHFLERGILPVDFFYIGANAGQQAMKAMGIMRNFFEAATEGKSQVFFQPNRVKTEVTDEGTGEKMFKDASYWRAYVLRTDQALQMLKTYGTV